MMKPILLSLSLIIPLLARSCPASFKPLRLNDSVEVVFKDTIHVHGKVLDGKGNPLSAIEVSSGYYRGLVSTVTNSEGDFLLKNVQPKDTIFFSGGNRFAKISNEGSRILNLTLPEIGNRRFEGTVTAKRQIPRQPKNSTVKIEERGGIFIDYGNGPEPYGGYSKFEMNLQTELIYPDKARRANIEGIVKIEFVIDGAGKPTAFKTINGLGFGCEEAVIDVLNETKWRPGVYNGHLYSPTMSVKVLFKLKD